jgi:hypothetical protein
VQGGSVQGGWAFGVRRCDGDRCDGVARCREDGPLACDGDRCDGVARASSARVGRERNRAEREN